MISPLWAVAIASAVAPALTAHRAGAVSGISGSMWGLLSLVFGILLGVTLILLGL